MRCIDLNFHHVHPVATTRVVNLQHSKLQPFRLHQLLQQHLCNINGVRTRKELLKSEEAY